VALVQERRRVRKEIQAARATLAALRRELDALPEINAMAARYGCTAQRLHQYASGRFMPARTIEERAG
jgi:hypothetical protein